MCGHKAGPHRRLTVLISRSLLKKEAILLSRCRWLIICLSVPLVFPLAANFLAANPLVPLDTAFLAVSVSLSCFSGELVFRVTADERRSGTLDVLLTSGACCRLLVLCKICLPALLAVSFTLAGLAANDIAAALITGRTLYSGVFSPQRPGRIIHGGYKLFPGDCPASALTSGAAAAESYGPDSGVDLPYDRSVCFLRSAEPFSGPGHIPAALVRGRGAGSARAAILPGTNQAVRKKAGYSPQPLLTCCGFGAEGPVSDTVMAEAARQVYAARYTLPERYAHPRADGCGRLAAGSVIRPF